MQMHFAPKNLLNELKINNKSFIVSYGSEPVLINSIKEDISKSCKELDIEKQAIVYDFKLTVDEIKSKFQNQSLFSKKTLFEITFTGGKISTEVKDFLKLLTNEISDNIFIIYFVNPTKDFLKSAWYTKLIENCMIISAQEPTPNQIRTAIEQRTLFHKVKIDDEGLEILINMSLGNLLFAENEIKKLSLMFKENPIGVKDLIYQISNGSKFDGFQLLEHCINGEMDKTLLAVKNLQQEAAYPIMINGIFAWFFRALIKLKYSPNSLSNASFQKLRIFGNSQKLASKAIMKLSANEVERSLKKIKEIDFISKGLQSGDAWFEFNAFCFRISRIMSKK